jgi:hypothetical protein
MQASYLRVSLVHTKYAQACVPYYLNLRYGPELKI